MNTLTKFIIIIWSSALLTACGGGSDSDSSTDISQGTTKLAPIANVGADISTDENTTVTLDGSNSSDSDGSIVEYLWKQDSGSYDVEITGSNQSIASFSAPNIDSDLNLVFELTVTDNDGISSKDYLNVTILRVNQQPIANISANLEVNGDELVTIDGSNSNDPDGSIASYAWAQTSGTNVAITNANQAIASFTAPNVNAQLVFELTITDNEGATNTQSITVTTIEQTPEIIENQTPVANVQKTVTVDGGEQVILNGAASSDPDGNIVNYNWAQTSGSPSISFTKTQSSQATTSFIAPNVNTVLIFQLSVTDNNGATNTNSVTVTISEVVPENQAPIANAGINLSTDENTLISLNGSASNDPDGSIVSYSWVQTSGTRAAITNASLATASITAPEVDADTQLGFKLTVTDNEGETATDTMIVSILNVNKAPTAVAGNNFSSDENTQVTLDGSTSSDTDGTISSYSWTQIAGSPMVAINSPTASVASFTAPDVSETTTLTFELVITDNEGEEATDTISVSILDIPVNNAPDIDGVPASSVNEDNFYNFTPVTTDPDDDILIFSVSNLPQWATFDTESGTISGTPTASDIGYYGDIIISVYDGEATALLSGFSIQVLTALNIVELNPLLNEISGYSIFMGTTPDTLSLQNSLDIDSGIINSIDVLATDTNYMSIVPLDVNDGDIFASNPDLVGYRVYIGSTSDTLFLALDITADSENTFSVGELAIAGTYYVSIVVYDVNGFESMLSDIVELNVL